MTMRTVLHMGNLFTLAAMLLIIGTGLMVAVEAVLQRVRRGHQEGR
jgi:hypothetical protein